jgi:hypothetical protein
MPDLDCLIHVRIPNTHPNLQEIKKSNTSRNPEVIWDFRIEIIRINQMHRLVLVACTNCAERIINFCRGGDLRWGTAGDPGVLNAEARTMRNLKKKGIGTSSDVNPSDACAPWAPSASVFWARTGGLEHTYVHVNGVIAGVKFLFHWYHFIGLDYIY